MTIANPLNSDGGFIMAVISKPILSREGSSFSGAIPNPAHEIQLKDSANDYLGLYTFTDTFTDDEILTRYVVTHIPLATCSKFRKQTGFLRQEITVVYGGRSILLNITSTDVSYLLFNSSCSAYMWALTTVTVPTVCETMKFPPEEVLGWDTERISDLSIR